jgi:DNA-binding NtrC family response regulator
LTITPPDGAASRPRRAVMVVDSEVLVRATLAAYLRDCGYRVMEASGLHEATTVLRESEFKVEAVLSDVDAGGDGDGFALAIWVRKNLPGVHVILAGSHAKAAAAAGDLCEEGPQLTKPYDHQLVLARIRQLLSD